MAGRLSDQMFLVGSVDIDLAVAGVPIRVLESLEPEDAGEDPVLFPARLRDFSGRQAAFKNRPSGGLPTKFSTDSEPPERGPETSGRGTEAEF